MFCPKCGAQIEDNSVYCAKCGEKLSEQQGTNTVVVVQNSVNSKSLFNTAFILNIISVIGPGLVIIASMISSMFQKENPSQSSGSVRFEFDLITDSLITLLRISVIIYVLIFIFGILIYVLKKTSKIKLLVTLTVIYLCVSIVNMIMCVTASSEVIFVTCGVGLIFLVPGILQIIAGTKYVKAASNLKKQNV